MRSTIRIQEELLTEARDFAARCGMTATEVVEEAVRRLLDAAPALDEVPRRESLPLSEDGTSHGIGPDHCCDLLEVMGSG
ncbi:MAG: hypothetical protein ACR2N9_06250 [Acidimicrobiia bacterium]